MGPRWARCKLGSDLKPRSITMVMDLGCWVLPSRVRSLKDHRTLRSHPNKAVDVVPTKLFRYLLACERSTYVDPSCSHPSSHGSPPFGPFTFSSALAR